MVNMESLTDDLLFDILVRLPAQDIYQSGRLVCRRWYHLIGTRNFKCAHFEHTTSGLLLNYFERPVFVAMRLGRIEISDLSYKFRDEVWASCNGLILECEFRKNRKVLYIANPTTNKQFVLPPFSHGIYHPFPGIAYAAASMAYKVAIMYTSVGGGSEVLRFSILTVGVDNSWRDIPTEHLPLTIEGQFWEDDPIITEGFMHWTIKNTHVLTLNVETEVITQTPLPQVHGEDIDGYYLSMGRHLSLLIPFSGVSWEVWEMKLELGEWKWAKLTYIDLKPQMCRLERIERYQNQCYHTLVPVGWLKHQEVFVFGIYGPSKACLAYNVHTQEIDLFELDFPCECYDFVVHRNSLLWLGGC